MTAITEDYTRSDGEVGRGHLFLPSLLSSSLPSTLAVCLIHSFIQKTLSGDRPDR